LPQATYTVIIYHCQELLLTKRRAMAGWLDCLSRAVFC